MGYLTKVLVAIVMSGAALYASAGAKEVKENLTKSLPGLKIATVEESEIKGLYRVVSENSEILFANEDASYFLSGQMFTMDKGRVVNLTEQRKGKDRAARLAAISDKDKIVYPAKGSQKASITVFTDIDCGYCRKLHQEIPEMNELGIQVSYVAYPRAGVGSPSYDKIVSAWCSDDPLQAMTDAKAGKSIPAKTCDNPVAEQYQLGMDLGVTGTPAILLEDGTLVPGYIPARQLAKALGI